MAFVIKNKSGHTAKDIQIAVFRYMRDAYSILVPNVNPASWAECDLLGVRKSDYVEELEVKISRSDFKNDAKKTVVVQNGDKYPTMLKYEALERGLAPINYFSYVVPAGLLEPNEVPDFAGLIYIAPGGYPHRVKKAKLLHKRKATYEDKFHYIKTMPFRVWDYMMGKRGPVQLTAQK